MEKKPNFVPYDKASKTEQRLRDEKKRSQIKIPPNQTHKSAKDYDRKNEQLDINQEIVEWEKYDG